MEIKATAKNLRISPKKVRLVVDSIRGKSVQDAADQLFFMNKAAAKPVLKLLKSAIANASNNYQVTENDLFIKRITVDDAVTLKRWMPRAFGRATPLRKRGSHINIVLSIPDSAEEKVNKEGTEKDNKADALQKDVLPTKGEKIKVEKNEENTQEEHSPEIFDQRMASKHRHQQHSDKRSMKSKGGYKKNLFNRKTDS